MKVLVATSKTQGQRKNDFCFVPEGELVTFSMECDGESIDGSCGCRRAMAGMICHKATTTFTVKEMDVDLQEEIKLSLISAGWCKTDDDNLEQWSKDLFSELTRLAKCFPLNIVLEKRGDKIQTRI